jgi:hypothetical protein
MNIHCWHHIGSNTGEDQDEVCCFCGKGYHPTQLEALPGHGPYSPDLVRPSKPISPCVGRQMKIQGEKK